MLHDAIFGILAFCAWCYMHNESTARRIRNSRWWPLALLTGLVLAVIWVNALLILLFGVNKV
jgi:hypothetical protein